MLPTSTWLLCCFLALVLHGVASGRGQPSGSDGGRSIFDAFVNVADEMASRFDEQSRKMAALESLVNSAAPYIGSRVQCRAERVVDCELNIQAYSGHQDPTCRPPSEGFVRLNGSLVVWNASWCGVSPNRRGVSVLDVDPFRCRLNGVRQFDTWASAADAADLTAYLQYGVRDGAVLVGVTGDEPMTQLGPTQTTLRALGVYVGDVPVHGNFAFVVQKGFSYKTIFAKGNLAAPAKIDVRLKGTTIDDMVAEPIR